VPGLGVRCVSDEPWVTGAETCELAIALAALGHRDQAMELFGQIQFLRAEDGSYWTGWQFVNGKHFPHEQSTWTAAAVVLAADVLAANLQAVDGAANSSAANNSAANNSAATGSAADNGAATDGTSTGAAGIFQGAAAGPDVWQAPDPTACGCSRAS